MKPIVTPQNDYMESLLVSINGQSPFSALALSLSTG